MNDKQIKREKNEGDNEPNIISIPIVAVHDDGTAFNGSHWWSGSGPCATG